VLADHLALVRFEAIERSHVEKPPGSEIVWQAFAPLIAAKRPEIIGTHETPDPHCTFQFGQMPDGKTVRSDGHLVVFDRM
jgi:hypothetical protein